MRTEESTPAAVTDVLDDRRVFISYSRSEAPIVEDLTDALQSRGVRTFVDYRDLVPGAVWDTQLERSMEEARAAVVVVSDRSIWATPNTKKEWLQAIRLGQHIVLAIVDPVPLPPGLAACAWVDLRRGRFGARVDDVVKLLEPQTQIAPLESQPAPPPGPGWRRPLQVWVAVALAAVASLLSLLALWTIALPLVVLPLPFRILQRSFDYSVVRLALVAQVLLLIVYAGGLSFTWLSWLGYVSLVGTLPVIALLFVLRSRSFRRWMQPAGARPRVRDLPPATAWEQPSRRRFRVHAAPQDRRYVDEVVSALEARRYGHCCRERVGPGDEPSIDGAGIDVVLQFVSKFNDRAETAPGVVTLPVLLSETDDPLPVTLKRTQWIDFRHGGRRRRRRELEHLAACFDRPAEILRRLGATPAHMTRVLPRGVRALHDLLAGGLVAIAATVVIAVFSRVAPKVTTKHAQVSFGAYVNMTVSLVVLVALTGFLLDRLTHRRPTRWFGLYLPVLYIVLLWTMVALTTIVTIDDAGETVDGTPIMFLSPSTGDALAETTSFIGLFVVLFAVVGYPILWLLTRRETSMWMPRVREEGRAEDSTLPSLVTAARGFVLSVREMASDATGMTIRAGMKERRRREAPPEAASDQTMPTAGSADV